MHILSRDYVLYMKVEVIEFKSSKFKHFSFYTSLYCKEANILEWLLSQEVDSTIWVQALSKVVFISLCAYTFGKVMNPTILSPAWTDRVLWPCYGNQSRRRKTLNLNQLFTWRGMGSFMQKLFIWIFLISICIKGIWEISCLDSFSCGRVA